MQKLLFVFAPTLDIHDRFFSCWPGSLLHALAPLVNGIDSGQLNCTYVPLIFHPKVVTTTTYPDFKRLLELHRPTVVVFSSTYDSWNVALILAELVKEFNPDTITIHGGPHLDEVLEPWVLRRMPNLNPFSVNNLYQMLIDFAVGGDGEYVLQELVKDICRFSKCEALKHAIVSEQERYESLPGKGTLSFFHHDIQFFIRFRNKISLDKLPYVPRHLLPKSAFFDFECFKKKSGERYVTATMLTHRGCKARCSFCSEGLPYQPRPLHHILSEVRILERMGVKAIFFDDSNIQDNPEYLKMLSEISCFGFKLGALTRFDLLQDLAAVREMRRSGVVYLFASIEQYDDNSLRDMNKRLSTSQIDRAIENLKSAGIRLGISVLFGLPDEKPKAVDSTLNYVARRTQEGCIQYVSMSLYSFHPRTPFGNRFKETIQGLRFDRDPPNLRYPFNGFEEGSWYHSPHVTDKYVEDILVRAKLLFGGYLVREIAKHKGHC